MEHHLLRDCRLALVLALILALPWSAQARDEEPRWPSSDVTVTVPYPQGGETDALFSLLGEMFTSRTGRTMTINHLPGQAGGEAWARVVDDPADGSIITLMTFPNAFLRSMSPDSGIAPPSIAVCNVIASSPCVLWSARPGAFDTVDAVAEAARTMDGNFLMAGPGSLSAARIAARTFDRQAGVRTTYIPYQDSVGSARAVLNRQASLFWAYPFLPAAIRSDVRPMAVAAPQRIPALPAVPTLAEQGYEVTSETWFGVAVPADTPGPIQRDIAAFFAAAAASEPFQRKAREMGFEPRNLRDEALVRFLRSQREDALAVMEDFKFLEQWIAPDATNTFGVPAKADD